ncbi:hypothetical protein VF14_18380 [Nostoc linckia z18]|uniref:Bacteriophage Mu Gp45 N-terminal domain-containing protein n=3 Tax=Nostoc linckia TaxID=92942 RepID=A0A9Q6EJH6_NOSLI|nr:hypothetical protein VF07_29150 [Nostoc linckia z6]PHJ92883.1 hypothetical protein VF04_27865 [Nostoc linckia z7]PHK00829.1 hypothetical protein VF08_23380 [Nostoc linckia z8]PHK09363.1 hypothetical protein VF09_15925 [Nostoc linckia z9]PHK33118.1 hypothetical protein VF14_18380 [Nostoc linckia z18]
MNLRSLQKMMQPLHQRIMMAVGRGVVRLVDDSLKMQAMQVTLMEGETRATVERFQNYGFTSHPQPGAECIGLAIGGNRDHCVIIAVDDRRFRLKSLAPGEVALYTDEGDVIHLKRGRTIEVTTQTFLVKAGTKVRFETPTLECTGDIVDQAGGNARTMAGMRGVFNAHTHPENGGTTSPTLTGM